MDSLFLAIFTNSQEKIFTMNKKISLSLSLALALCLTSACTVKNSDSTATPQATPSTVAIATSNLNENEYNNATEKEAVQANLQAFFQYAKAKNPRAWFYLTDESQAIVNKFLARATSLADKTIAAQKNSQELAAEIGVEMQDPTSKTATSFWAEKGQAVAEEYATFDPELAKLNIKITGGEAKVTNTQKPELVLTMYRQRGVWKIAADLQSSQASLDMQTSDYGTKCALFNEKTETEAVKKCFTDGLKYAQSGDGQLWNMLDDQCKEGIYSFFIVNMNNDSTIEPSKIKALKEEIAQAFNEPNSEVAKEFCQARGQVFVKNYGQLDLNKGQIDVKVIGDYAELVDHKNGQALLSFYKQDGAWKMAVRKI